MSYLPITYLGIPLHWKKLTFNDWLPLVHKIEKKIDSWKGKLLSIGGRLTLIKSVLSAIPLYWLSIFKMPSKVRKRIEQLVRRLYGSVVIQSERNML